jgi:NodT family efflux transporter outer membrane factor (OMF) lipoprotein
MNGPGRIEMKTGCGSPLRWAALRGAARPVRGARAAGCVSSAGIAPQAQMLDAADVGVPGKAPGADLSDRWWTAFGDPQLDKLVETALAANPSLKVAHDRSLRAAAATSAAQANAGPRVDADLDLQRQRYTENGLIPPPIAGSVGNTGLFQLSGSWEIDFFGKNAAALGAALGAQRAAEADAQAARVLLAANVARSYFQLGGLFEQRAVAERALAQRQEILALIRQRVEAGLDTNVELRQGEAAVPETARQIEVIDERIAHTRHALAALTAQPAGALDTLASRLRTVQAVPLPDDIPADLLGRRADIEAARQRVEAAMQEVAHSKTLLYPNVNLIAFAGLPLGEPADQRRQRCRRFTCRSSTGACVPSRRSRRRWRRCSRRCATPPTRSRRCSRSRASTSSRPRRRRDPNRPTTSRCSASEPGSAPI